MNVMIWLDYMFVKPNSGKYNLIAERTFDELGLNMTTAFTIFVKEAVRRRGIPFELTLDPFYSEKNMRVLEESIRDADAGKVTAHDLIEDQAMQKLWTDRAWGDYLCWQACCAHAELAVLEQSL